MVQLTRAVETSKVSRMSESRTFTIEPVSTALRIAATRTMSNRFDEGSGVAVGEDDDTSAPVDMEVMGGAPAR